MTKLKIPLLSPIRFYNPNLSFGNYSTFQNPDNRVSTGYNWENVNSVPYHLPIPKQWPDGQAGIDFIVNVDASGGTFYARLYDSDDVLYKSLYLQSRGSYGTDTQYRVYLDGLSGSGITDGYYTIKLFDTSDDALLFESEALYIAEFFEDMIPFEFWNFETDFGIIFDSGVTKFTGRMMMPIRIYDAEPEFEKEVYQNDPGVVTTLRTIMQRVFNFDSLVVPTHVAETFVMAFSCSELYLDRIKINSDSAPTSELVDGTNLKQIEGKATLVDFPGDFTREKVETSFEDQSKDWLSGTYGGMVITNNSVSINDPVVSGILFVISYSYAGVEDDLILVKVVLTDDGTSDLPLISFDGVLPRVLEWGTNWFSYRVNDTTANKVTLSHLNGERAVFTAVLTIYTVE